VITGITSLFRGGPLDGRTAQMQSAPNVLRVTGMINVVDGDQVQVDDDELVGVYRLVEATQVEFARQAMVLNLASQALEPGWVGEACVLDGTVYEWDDAGDEPG